MPTNGVVTEGNKQVQQNNKFLYPGNQNDRINTVAGKLETNVLVTENNKKANQSFNHSMYIL